MNHYALNIVLTAISLGGALAACAVDPADGLDDGPAEATAAQAVTYQPMLVTCENTPDCIFASSQPSYRARFEVLLAGNAEWNSWIYPHDSTVVSGCGRLDAVCELDLRSTCALAPSAGPFRRKILVVNERSGLLPFGSSSNWLGSINIPSDGCMQQACTSPPTEAPVMTVLTDYCRGRHTRTWSAVSGATYYQVQAKPWWDTSIGIGPTTPWDAIPEGLGYPGVIVDLPGTQCPGNSNHSYDMRARACNDCGCTDWGTPDYFQYWTGSCA